MATTTIEAKADRVISSGASGTWSWRKWKSGKIEAWCRNGNAGTATPATWVAPVKYNDLTLAIPSGIFDSAPMTVASSGSNQYWVNNVSASSPTNINLRVCTLASSQLTYYVNLYAVSI